jgi:hypothetical protein
LALAVEVVLGLVEKNKVVLHFLQLEEQHQHLVMDINIMFLMDQVQVVF